MVEAADRERFRGWATAARPGLHHTAFLLAGDWFLADDLVQEALIRMYLAWPRLSPSPEPSRYARRVLVNVYLDHRRRPSRREHPTDDVPLGTSAHMASQEFDVRAGLLAALREVPPGQRAVLVLRFFEDYSVEQTAHALGTSEGNVKSQTSRGLAALRRALTDRGIHDSFDLPELT
jgi:RNA polymerase sigma-70 factor (sigma-E family)